MGSLNTVIYYYHRNNREKFEKEDAIYLHLALCKQKTLISALAGCFKIMFSRGNVHYLLVPIVNFGSDFLFELFELIFWQSPGQKL